MEVSKPTQASKRKLKKNRRKLSEEEKEAKNKAFQGKVGEYKSYDWDEQTVTEQYQTNINNIKAALKSLRQARWNLSALRDAYPTYIKQIKNRQNFENAALNNPAKKMTADINLMSKMPSYLMPFKN